MKLKVNVLATDIKHGKCADPWNCAVARATARAFKPIKYQVRSVGNVLTYADDVGFLHEAFLPVRVGKFIQKFDNPEVPKASLKPFSFSLTL